MPREESAKGVPFKAIVIGRAEQEDDNLSRNKSQQVVGSQNRFGIGSPPPRNTFPSSSKRDGTFPIRHLFAGTREVMYGVGGGLGFRRSTSLSTAWLLTTSVRQSFTKSRMEHGKHHVHALRCALGYSCVLIQVTGLLGQPCRLMVLGMEHILFTYCRDLAVLDER